MSRYNELLREFERFAPSAPSTVVLMDHVAERLHEKMAHYNWVGFYLLGKDGMLDLGPFAGSASRPLNLFLWTRDCAALPPPAKEPFW